MMSSEPRLKKALTDPTVFDECDISDDVKAKLIEDIRKKLTPQALKIRADIEISCFSYEGVEAVRSALMEGKKHSTEEMPIKVSRVGLHSQPANPSVRS